MIFANKTIFTGQMSPGCNAPSVAQYIVSALSLLYKNTILAYRKKRQNWQA